MARLDFDASTVAPQAPMDSTPLPAGLYTVECTSADVKDLKSGNGVGLSLEFTVIDPAPYARRKVWSTLNIKHNNPQAEQIGQSQLSALCFAVGVTKLGDSDELFGRVLRVRTKIREAQGQYSARAEITGYESASTPMPAAAHTHTPAPAPAPAAPAKAAPPWQRKAA